jgi:hypothetical protein
MSNVIDLTSENETQKNENPGVIDLTNDVVDNANDLPEECLLESDTTVTVVEISDTSPPSTPDHARGGSPVYTGDDAPINEPGTSSTSSEKVSLVFSILLRPPAKATHTEIQHYLETTRGKLQQQWVASFKAGELEETPFNLPINQTGYKFHTRQLQTDLVRLSFMDPRDPSKGVKLEANRDIPPRTIVTCYDGWRRVVKNADRNRNDRIRDHPGFSLCINYIHYIGGQQEILGRIVPKLGHGVGSFLNSTTPANCKLETEWKEGVIHVRTVVRTQKPIFRGEELTLGYRID